MVLVNVRRKVDVLEEDVSYEPLLCTTDISRGNTGNTVALEVGWVYWSEEQISGVDVEVGAPETDGYHGGGRARDGETTLTIGLGSWDLGVDSGGVSSGGDDQSGTWVPVSKDGRCN